MTVKLYSELGRPLTIPEVDANFEAVKKANSDIEKITQELQKVIEDKFDKETGFETETNKGWIDSQVVKDILSKYGIGSGVVGEVLQLDTPPNFNGLFRVSAKQATGIPTDSDISLGISSKYSSDVNVVVVYTNTNPVRCFTQLYINNSPQGWQEQYNTQNLNTNIFGGDFEGQILGVGYAVSESSVQLILNCESYNYPKSLTVKNGGFESFTPEGYSFGIAPKENANYDTDSSGKDVGLIIEGFSQLVPNDLYVIKSVNGSTEIQVNF